MSVPKNAKAAAMVAPRIGEALIPRRNPSMAPSAKAPFDLGVKMQLMMNEPSRRNNAIQHHVGNCIRLSSARILPVVELGNMAKVCLLRFLESSIRDQITTSRYCMTTEQLVRLESVAGWMGGVSN